MEGDVFFMDKHVQMIKVVEANSGAKFQDLYNKTAEELAEYDPEIEIEHKASGHCAYFMYEVNIAEKMTIKEALHAVGIYHTCSECPCLEIGQDGRRKKWNCERSSTGFSYSDSDMCDDAYKDLVNGDLQLIKR